MYVYFAIANKSVFCGGFIACASWARKRLNEDSDLIIKILKGRAGEKNAKITHELCSEYVRFIPDGREFPLSKLKRMLKNEQKEEQEPRALF